MIAFLVFVLCAGCSSTPSSPRRIALATTTSVDNSGLLKVLLPAFTTKTAIDVQLVTPGSGIALDMLRRGDVDVAISHAPARESELLRKGGWFYRKIMFNDFVIVGPPNDPAQVRAAANAEDAMRRIARSEARFISRGDSSGTHERERELWTRAGATPKPDQVVVAGSGMGATLRIAATTSAYTLTDRATFAHYAGRPDITVLYENAGEMLNSYAVITRADVGADVREFTRWLVEGNGRGVIASFRTASGTSAFAVWPTRCPGDSPAATLCYVVPQ